MGHTYKDKNGEKTHRATAWRRTRGISINKTTLVLAGILAVCLLTAQIISVKNNRKGELAKQAAQNAADLISSVAGNGLADYLGKDPITRYYLLETDNKPIGYSVINIEPIMMEDRSQAFVYRDVSILIDQARKIESRTVIANDLSEYYSTKEFKGHPIEILMLKDGQLTGGSPAGNKKESFMIKDKTDVNNLIPPPLLDFFSSLVDEQIGSDGVIFAVPNVVFHQQLPNVIHFNYFWVSTETGMPPQFDSAEPPGQFVRVKQFGGQKPLTQSILYDQQHQIILQQNSIGSPEFYRAVTKSKLTETYPEAEILLTQWLNEKEVIR